MVQVKDLEHLSIEAMTLNRAYLSVRIISMLFHNTAMSDKNQISFSKPSIGSIVHLLLIKKTITLYIS
jgi:hypothetical protein